MNPFWLLFLLRLRAQQWPPVADGLLHIGGTAAAFSSLLALLNSLLNKGYLSAPKSRLFSTWKRVHRRRLILGG